MSQPINIGIVGLGFMAATHIRAYRQVEGAQDERAREGRRHA